MTAGENLSQAFFDSADAALQIKDEGGFLLINRHGAELLGMTEAENVGKTGL